MALDETTFAQNLKKIFDDMNSAASDSPKDSGWYAEQIAKAVTAHIKTAEIVAGKVIVSVSGGSGAPAAGTPNPAPITVV